MLRKPLLLVAVLVSSAPLAATDSSPAGIVRFWDAAGPITPLERAAVVQVPASPAIPATWEIKGVRSTFRVKRSPALLFLVRLPDRVTPSQMQLFHLTGSAARKPYPPQDSWRTVTLSATEAGDSIGLAPVGELVEGEYAFLRAGSNEAYCFGIDPPK